MAQRKGGKNRGGQKEPLKARGKLHPPEEPLRSSDSGSAPESRGHQDDPQDTAYIESMEELYTFLQSSEDMQKRALLLLQLTDWFLSMEKFDPSSGYPLPTFVSELLGRTADYSRRHLAKEIFQDRLTRIFEHSFGAMEAILRSPRRNILRTHEQLPFHAAKEFDSATIRWLSQQTGRTVREKLSAKSHIKAVKRSISIDTPENSLFKVFLERLRELLEARNRAYAVDRFMLGEIDVDRFLQKISHWLREDDVIQIRPWRNLPPNNTLLEDRNYRRIWDSWLWIHNLKENIIRDQQMLTKIFATVLFWTVLSKLHVLPGVHIAQQPVIFGSIKLKIKPMLPVEALRISPGGPAGKKAAKVEEFTFEYDPNNPEKLMFGLGAETVRISFQEASFSLITASGEESHVYTFLDIEDLALKIIDILIEGEKEFSSQKIEPLSGRRAYVDINAVRPGVLVDSSSGKLPFRLLCQYWNHEEEGELLLDCGDAKALYFREDAPTLSMKSLFLLKSDYTASHKNSAAIHFAKKLREYLPVDSLHYLIPDWANDFDLEGVRKSINLKFDDSLPLPKSIAAVFRWQGSEAFQKKDAFHDKDIVLVLDAFEEGISVTPLQGVYSENLARKLPETKGFFWERHPTTILKNKNLFNEIKKRLFKECQDADFSELFSLFDFEGLEHDAGEFSFLHNEAWHHVPFEIREILSGRKINEKISFGSIEKKSPLLSEKKDSSKLFILPVNRMLEKDGFSGAPAGSMWIHYSENLLEGARRLALWQTLSGDTPLWRDHLPELSIKVVYEGLYQKFYLVKGATVTPQLGLPVPIPVEENFTLPAGKNFYRFPLYQGEGGESIQFAAYLTSPAFPLQEDTRCTLRMTYTYGADDPYELEFCPLDTKKAGFTSARVEWRVSAGEEEKIDLTALPVPKFPPALTWADLRKYPNKNGKGTRDLLEWVEGESQKIQDIRTYGRVKAPIGKWRTNQNGKFCFVKFTCSGSQAEDQYINEFSFKSREELPSEGTQVSFYRIRRGERFVVEDLCVGEKEPERCFLQKSLRFPVIAIWKDGRTLSDFQAPEGFRKTVAAGIEASLKIINDPNMPESLKDELFLFLSRLHRDAPAEVAKRLVEIAKNKEYVSDDTLKQSIAFAMGTGELPWQREVLFYVVSAFHDKKPPSTELFQILSVALWRAEGLVFNLDKEQIELLVKKTLESFSSFCAAKIKKGFGAKNKYVISYLRVISEVLLALLRTRDFEDHEIKALLSPERSLVKKSVELLDEISASLVKHDIKLVSRVGFQLQKPEALSRTPDLLYALRMYLSGESVGDSIIITGITDDD